MPDVLTRDELHFLTELDRLGREGLTQSEAAAVLGVAPGTVTYRVARTRRLRVKRVRGPIFRLEDARTGEPLDELIARGEIRVAEEQVPA